MEYGFPYLEARIARIFSLASIEVDGLHTSFLVDHETCHIQATRHWNAGRSLEDLAQLAKKCDEIVFSEAGPPTIKASMIRNDSLVRLASEGLGVEHTEEVVFVASLLALNRLESVIRSHTGYTVSKAPLLTIMLQGIVHRTNKAMGQVLQLLLLPAGMNLRNVVWHGFVHTVPRPWLSLLILLVYQVESIGNIGEGKLPCTLELPPALSNLRNSHAALGRAAQLGQDVLEDTSHSTPLQNDVPPSHLSLWCFAMNLARGKLTTRTHPPWLVATALLVIVLEHTLRLKWSEVNNRPQDSCARVGHFYVTLDGHGQRHKHNLLLHPTVIHENGRSEQNMLRDTIGASATSLLLDLMASPAGGPNLRAALSHGALDDHLHFELDSTLLGLDHASGEEQCDSEALFNVILLAACYVESNDKLDAYRPVFSYASKTRTGLSQLQSMTNVLWPLDSIDQSSSPCNNGTIAQLLKFVDDALFLEGPSQGWTTKMLYDEERLNERLAPYKAAQTLLEEIVGAVEMLNGCSAAFDTRVLHFYSFAIVVCLQALHAPFRVEDKLMSKKDMLELVKRTRMTLSTVVTFVHKNIDRSIGGINKYYQARIVKVYCSLDNCEWGSSGR